MQKHHQGTTSCTALYICTYCKLIPGDQALSRLHTGVLVLKHSGLQRCGIRSPQPAKSAHTKKLENVTLNETMRILTGCLRPTPVKHLPVLSGIAPPPLHREHHTNVLVKKASQDPTHLQHSRIKAAKDLANKRLKLPLLSLLDFPISTSWNNGKSKCWQQTDKPIHFNIAPGLDLPPGARLPTETGSLYAQELAVSAPACIAGVCALQQSVSVATRNRPHVMSCLSALTSDCLEVHKWTSLTQTQRLWHGYVSSKTLCSGRSYERSERSEKQSCKFISVT